VFLAGPRRGAGQQLAGISHELLQIVTFLVERRDRRDA
jgi:hypothetical protein